VEYLGEIISFILGAFGGSLVTWQVMTKAIRASGRSTAIDQSGASAGGDIVGGNKTNKS
jgi:hypothetical protein